jgi:two-component system sensor histidine kinase KdpD
MLLASATALLLGAAVATADTGADRTLALSAFGSFLLLVVLGGLWARRSRVEPSDAAAERAATATQIARELRDPLLSIKGLSASGIRLYDEMNDEGRREFFRLVDQEASRLKLAAEQIATALQIDADRLEYDRREEDLGALIEEIAWQAPHGDHPMVVETEPKITVEIDRRRVGEALTNLIDNAAKFSPPDAPIEVRAYRDERGDAVIEVGDHGPGIPPDRHTEVFTRFTSWRPPGYEETPGVGVGMYIARAHVRAQGGRIGIADREDAEEGAEEHPGTTLRVILPTAR